MTPQLSLAIPCYNEEAVLRGTVLDLTRAFHAEAVAVELVLVDNGSTDGTGAVIEALVAEGLPVVKVEVPVNQGYGHGVLQGLAACTAPLVGFICADGQVDARDVVRLYQVAARGGPKLAKVRRRFRLDGWDRKAVSVAWNLGANALFGGLGSIDINGNPKILPAEVVRAMQLESRDWFLDAEVLIKARRMGLEVFEMNVIAQMREGGRSHVKPSTCLEFLKNANAWRHR